MNKSIPDAFWLYHDRIGKNPNVESRPAKTIRSTIMNEELTLGFLNDLIDHESIDDDKKLIKISESIPRINQTSSFPFDTWLEIIKNTKDLPDEIKLKLYQMMILHKETFDVFKILTKTFQERNDV